MFFFLLQTEQGDIFKVTLESEDDVVRLVILCFNHRTLFVHVGVGVGLNVG
jgi:FAD/FMN-containing dehydrogenase